MKTLIIPRFNSILVRRDPSSMLLNCQQPGFGRSVANRFAMLICLLIAATLPAVCQKRPLCYLDLPVYDAFGNRQRAEILSVVPEGRKEDLLKRKDEYRIVAGGERLYFSENLIAALPLEIKMRTRREGEFTTVVTVGACQQRESVQVGQRHEGADLAFQKLEGRIVGCPLNGDWWVRAMPMFGGREAFGVHEGYVSPADGSFSVVSGFRGARHVLVVGRGREVVTALGVDLVRGRVWNSLGVVKLPSCPE